MKNLICSFSALVIVMSLSSCLYDKGELAQPDIGCDTSYYTLQIKPIIDNDCAISGCHVTGGSGNGDFTTYAGMKPYLDNGSVANRINLDANDPFFMPQGATLPDTILTQLNEWIADGYAGCD